MRDAAVQSQEQPPAERLLPAGVVVTAMGTERATERPPALFVPAGTRAHS